MTRPETETVDTRPGVTITDARQPRRRRRRLLVGALAVVTCIGVLTSSLSYWVHSVLLDTDTWVATVGPLADDEQITDAVGDRLTTELFSVLDVEQRVAGVLPEQAAILATPLSSTLEGFVGDAVDDVLASDTFAEYWREVNRIVHQYAVAFIRGDTEVINAQDGVVTLNLLPLITRAIAKIEERAPGFVTSRVDLPDITADTPPDQAISQLEAFLGRDLPDTFGTVELFASDELGAVQDAVAWFDRLVVILPLLTVALGATTIFLAVDRRRLLMQLGAGITFTMVLVLALAGAVRNTVLEAITNPGARDATRATLATIFSELRFITWAIGIAGGVLVVAAFVTSDQRWAVALRARAGAIGGRAGDAARTGASKALSEQEEGFPQVTRHQTALRWGGMAVAAISLVFLSITWVVLLGVGVALGAWLVAISVLAGDPEDLPAPAPAEPV
jgi:hypothetical protein